MEEKIKVLCFGNLAEIVGSNSIEISFVNSTMKFTKMLLEKFPLLENIEFAIAINQKIIHENVAIKPNSEIALLPPFSGG